MPRRLAAVTFAAALAACSGEPSRPPPGTTTPSPSRVSLGAVASYDVGSRPRAVAVADLDGDGRLDVAVANSGSGTLTLLFGAKDGGFGRATTIAAGTEPSDVDAIDLDRDDDADLVVANHETRSVMVLNNDGRGRFAPAPGSPFDTGASPHIHGLATADFDGDGWPDIAVESSDSNEVRVLRGGPSGPQPPQPIAVGASPYFRLGVGKVSGDESPDILVPGHKDSTVRVVEHRDGALRASALTLRLDGQPWMVAGADVTGDDRDDIVVVQTDAISVWQQKGRSFTQIARSPFSLPGATEVAAGDIDGDRIADVAIGPWDGSDVTLLTKAGAATSTIETCERPIGLAIADLDADGRGELLATCATTDTLVVVG